MASTSNMYEQFGLPSADKLKVIEQRQTERALEIKQRRRRELAAQEIEEIETGRQRHAAEIIQRNYRGKHFQHRRAFPTSHRHRCVSGLEHH